MADDAKGGKPREAEPVFGTMQLPRGAVLDPDTAAPTEKTVVGEPTPGNAAPILPTAMPNTGAPMPIGAPPEMPAEWRYTYGIEIARGGMGRVVEATDTVLGRTVALKEALSLDPDAVRRFHRETRITARLEHPSIVPVHDAGIAPNGAPYYVMRKIGGRPLEELVGRSPDLEDRLALLPHIVAAANAIAHAHERGVVHRDIKPSNILAGELGETIVIDWGLAKAIGETDDATPRLPTAPQVVDADDDNVKTRAGVVFGTPGFMAPEQLRGAPVDERCDVYALGATLYHLLARRPPHYSKQGGEMMKAAVEGPPVPLRELVPGVSPELATIVDKALAHDRTARYHDARELADDLQRFLTGQLVASHHYSTREKLVRWVRRNRALVGVSGAAILALLVIGALAVSRIVAARDRADDQAKLAREQTKIALAERETVTEKMQLLTLTDARTKAAESPTRAVAMVKPLVASMWWREARDVAAAARASGVAFTLAASPHTLSLELSRDGTRALAAGDDGIVRIYDLVRRTSKTIADAKAATPARFGDAEHTVVLFRDTHVTLVDVATGSHRDIETPTPVVRLEVSGPIAYWIDPQHAVWKLDLAGGAPSKLALDEPIDAIVPSPDGRWVLLSGKTHLLLVDRTNSTLPPEAIADGPLRDVAWAADASHIVALTDDDLIDIAMQPSPTIIHRFTAIGTRRAIAYSNGHLFTTGPTGVAVITREDSKPRAATGDYTLGVREARGNTVVAGKPTAITLLSDDGDRTLSVPAPLRISRVEATPRGPFVIAATENHVLVWDLDAVLARHVAESAPSGASFVTGDQLIVTYLDAPAQWIDLRTDKTSPLGMIAGITQVAAAPDGLRAVVIDSTHHARIVAPVGDPVDVDGEIDHAAFLDDRRLVVATSTGVVRVDDRKQERGTVLVQHGGPVVALAASLPTPIEGGWIAAAYADRVLYRVKAETKPEVAKVELKAVPPRGGLAIAAGGEVVVGSGNEVVAWRTDGSLATLWTSNRLIVTVAFYDPTHVLAIAADGNAVFVDVRAKTVEAYPTTITNPSLTADGGLVASLVAPNGVDIIDPIARDRWSLTSPRGPPLGFAVISPDGRRVLASTTSGLLVWTLGLPPSADATSRWIDGLTNATDRGPSAALDWK